MPTPRKKSFTQKPRKRTESEKEAVRHHAEIIGNVAIHWNALHLIFQIFFALLLDKSDDSIGTAIWHSVKSDRTQRDMLNDLAAIKLKTKKKTLRHLQWAMDRAKDIGSIRNPIVHAPVFIKEVPHKVSVIYEEDASLGGIRYIKNDTFLTHKLAVLDLIKLERFVNSLAFHVISPERVSLPRRPSLRSPKMIQAINDQMSRSGQKVKRKRPHKPSRR